MKNENKTKEQLVNEIKKLKAQLSELQSLESGHKRHEKELRDSEAAYKTFFENTGTAIAIIEDNMTISLINTEFEKVTGYSKKEVENKMVWGDLVAKEDVDKMKAFHRARRHDPESAPRNYDFRFIDKAGNCNEAFVTVAMIPGTKKSLASLIDITETNSHAREFMESEKRFKELWDNAPVAYHILDINGTIVRVNQTELKMLGYKLSEMTGKPIFDFIVPEQRDKARERFCQKIDGKYMSKSENRVYIRKDGTSVYVSIDDIVERDSSGRASGIRSTMVDITERKKSEEDLREQKEFSIKLIQNSTTPTFVLDAQHNVIIWNKACEKVTGIKESSVIRTDSHWKAFYDSRRMTLADIIIEGNYKEIYNSENSYCKSDILSEGLHNEEWFANLGGKERYIVFDAAPVYNSKGELIAAIQTLRDITSHKCAEDELERSFKKLQTTLEETVNALASTAEKRDSYTAGHQHRVTMLACAIAQEMGLPAGQIEGVRVAATLHDIGKIYVPAEILNKPGRLIDLEMGLIKIHPKVGYDILKSIPFSWPVAQIVLQHHERIDGSGYPLGLSGGDILLEARILSVADVVEAIAFHRPYRPTMGIDKAMDEISLHKGILYDANVVDTCLKVFSKGGFKFE